MPSYAPDASLCISCVHVVNRQEPVNCVSHSGGDWVLLCDENRHSEEGADDSELVTIHYHHLTENDPSLIEVMRKLEVDYTAARNDKASAWRIYYDPDED